MNPRAALRPLTLSSILLTLRPVAPSPGADRARGGAWRGYSQIGEMKRKA